MAAFRARTVGWGGASGTVAGTAGADATESGLVPSPFVADTVHVYVLPLVRPPTVIANEVPPAVPGAPPSEDTQLAV